MAADLIALAGTLPDWGDPLGPTYLGVYKRCGTTNGEPHYEKVDDSTKMIWSYTSSATSSKYFFVGLRKLLGKATGTPILYVVSPAVSPEHVTEGWHHRRAVGGYGLLPKLELQAYVLSRPPAASPAAADVQVTGERTREEKDAELRKRAIDLDADTPRKRSRTQLSQLEERVATARSLTDSAIAKRMDALLQPALSEWTSDRIDDVEFKRRKTAARMQAEGEHQQRSALDAAFDAYTAAARAREAAWTAYGKAADDEEAAEAAVHQALAAMEPGPSGAVKPEA